MAECECHQPETDMSRLVFCRSPREAVQSAQAIAVVTDWDEFKQLPSSESHRAMMQPALLFDGRGLLNLCELEEAGFEIHAVGKGRGAEGRLRLTPDVDSCLSYS